MKAVNEQLFDPEIRAKAQAYHRAKNLHRCLGLLYVILFTVAVFCTPLARNLSTTIGDYGWRPALYLVVIAALFSVGNALIDYFAGYCVQRRFGLSVQTPGSWLGDKLKSFLMLLVLLVPLLLLLRTILIKAPSYWWLFAGIFYVLISVLLVNLSPVLIMPLFYKFTPLKDEQLKAQLEHLFAKTGSGIRGIYEMNMSSKTNAANAMITGTGHTRRMVLGDTLLSAFTADEIEAVMAHELAHHNFRHMPKILLLNSLIGIFSFWALSLIAPYVAKWLGYVNVTDPAFLPMLMIITVMIMALLDPLSNWYIRTLERQCDRYAVEVTGKPEAFIGAMARLADRNLSVLNVSPLEYVIYWDHPTIGQRIVFAESYEDFKGESPKGLEGSKGFDQGLNR